MQVGGAQRRSVVHNVVLYRCGGAQCSVPRDNTWVRRAALLLEVWNDVPDFLRVPDLVLCMIISDYVMSGT